MTAGPPLPPFTEQTARQKVQAAEDAWNTRDPRRVAAAGKAAGLMMALAHRRAPAAAGHGPGLARRRCRDQDADRGAAAAPAAAGRVGAGGMTVALSARTCSPDVVVVEACKHADGEAGQGPEPAAARRPSGTAVITLPCRQA